MESITIKVDEQMAKEIEKAMKPLYSTKTEFIREAIRDKIRAQRTQSLRENLGKAKVISDLSDRELKEKAFEEFMKERFPERKL